MLTLRVVPYGIFRILKRRINADILFHLANQFKNASFVRRVGSNRLEQVSFPDESAPTVPVDAQEVWEAFATQLGHHGLPAPLQRFYLFGMCGFAVYDRE